MRSFVGFVATASRALGHFSAATLLLLALAFGRQVLAGATEEELPARCSLVNLLASPRTYDGKRVQVIGYARLEFEGNALYLSALDAEHGVDSNSVWLDLSGWARASGQPIEGNRYVVVVGTFKEAEKGHMGMWPGGITRIERLDPWPPSWPPSNE